MNEPVSTATTEGVKNNACSHSSSWVFYALQQKNTYDIAIVKETSTIERNHSFDNMSYIHTKNHTKNNILYATNNKFVCRTKRIQVQKESILCVVSWFKITSKF